MKTVRTAVSVLGLMALFACATPEPEPVSAGTPRAPTIVEVPAPMPVQQPKDRCGANALQSLIGKPKTEIPVPVDPSKRRVSCSTCAVTMDYREDRLNIVFDVDTGIITQVKCG